MAPEACCRPGPAEREKAESEIDRKPRLAALWRSGVARRLAVHGGAWRGRGVRRAVARCGVQGVPMQSEWCFSPCQGLPCLRRGEGRRGVAVAPWAGKPCRAMSRRAVPCPPCRAVPCRGAGAWPGLACSSIPPEAKLKRSLKLPGPLPSLLSLGSLGNREPVAEGVARNGVAWSNPGSGKSSIKRKRGPDSGGGQSGTGHSASQRSPGLDHLLRDVHVSPQAPDGRGRGPCLRNTSRCGKRGRPVCIRREAGVPVLTKAVSFLGKPPGTATSSTRR